MACYNLIWLDSVRKDFKSIDKSWHRTIIDKVETLAENPRVGQCIKKLKGKEGYRLRVGDYCVVYEIDDKEKMIIVGRVRHRKDVYR